MTDRTDWDARAATYDSLAWVHNQDLLDWTASLAIAAAEAAVQRTGIDRVLEVGCGTGALTERLARTGIPVAAVDVSAEMLRAATSRLRDRIGQVGFIHVDPYWIPEAGLYPAIVSRMVLHHAPDDPLSEIRRWASAVPSGGVLVVAEGPPPSTDDRHDANHLYHAAMALKEPGRHVFHAHDVAEWMFASGCEQVQVTERWTEGNSVRGWLRGGGIEPGRAEAILALHREAPKTARDLYRIEETPDGDVLMRWRHCVVVGVRA